MGERDLLRLEYVPLSQIVLWERNPKLHDIGGIVESIRRHGFKDPLKFEPALNGGRGGIAEGGGRGAALRAMSDGGEEPPRGIDTLKDTGEWAAPVLFGVDADSEAAAEAYGVDHNNLTLLGAEGITPWDVMRMWDEEGYLSLLGDLAGEDVLPVSVGGDDLDALVSMLEIYGEGDTDGRRENNSMDAMRNQAFGEGGFIRCEIGEIMTMIPRGLYEQVFTAVSGEENQQGGIVKVLEIGLENWDS